MSISALLTVMLLLFLFFLATPHLLALSDFVSICPSCSSCPLSHFLLLIFLFPLLLHLSRITFLPLPPFCVLSIVLPLPFTPSLLLPPLPCSCAVAAAVSLLSIWLSFSFLAHCRLLTSLVILFHFIFWLVDMLPFLLIP